MNDAVLIPALYHEHRPWLQRWLRAKLGCPDHAADLVQDTFLRLLVRPREVSAKQNPGGYLRAIARGLLIDHLRRRELERAWLETLAALPEEAAPSPEDQVIVLDTLCRLAAVLDQLPDKPRRAFVLAQVHGQPQEEIATELGVSARMVRKYLAQAMLACLKLDEDANA